MSLHNYLEVMRRRWASVVIVALAALAAAAAVTLAMPTQYTATTRLFFAVEGSGTVTDLAQGSSFAEKQMTSYAEVATSPLVLNPVIDQLDLSTTSAALAERVEATIPPQTVILDVSAVDTDPSRAAAIANTVGDRVAEVTADLSPEREDQSNPVKATTLAPALVPTAPSSPNVLRNLLLGGVLGLMVGLGVALLRHGLDTRVRGEQDVRVVTDSPLLGAIGFDEKLVQHPVILRGDPLGAAAEAIRRLRTNFQFIDVGDRARSLVITSSVPGEGKSTTALNLAVALADAGSRVILVDADLRRPSVAESLGLEGQVGLTTVLIGRAKVADIVQRVSDTTLDVLPSGPMPPNPSELLGSSGMERLIAELTTSYDVVLLDSPPLLPVTDAAVLSGLTGGALMVVGADRVHRPQLRDAIGSLTAAGVHLHGVVLNRVARQEAGYYVYEPGYAPTNEPTKEHPLVAAPKRARIDPPRPATKSAPRPTVGRTRRPATAPASSSVPNGAKVSVPPTAGGHINGSDPPPTRRATPVGH